MKKKQQQKIFNYRYLQLSEHGRGFITVHVMTALGFFSNLTRLVETNKSLRELGADVGVACDPISLPMPPINTEQETAN